MKAQSKFTEFLRIVKVVVVALLIGFIITCFVSKDPGKAFWALLTGPLPKLSFDNGFQIKGINRFGNWIEESITLILAGLAVSIVFRARQFSLGAEGQLLLGALVSSIVCLYMPGPAVVVSSTALPRERWSVYRTSKARPSTAERRRASASPSRFHRSAEST